MICITATDVLVRVLLLVQVSLFVRAWNPVRLWIHVFMRAAIPHCYSLPAERSDRRACRVFIRLMLRYAASLAKLKPTRGRLTACTQIFLRLLTKLKMFLRWRGRGGGRGGGVIVGGGVCPAAVREMNLKMGTLPQRIPSSAQACHLIKPSFLFLYHFSLIGNSF